MNGQVYSMKYPSVTYPSLNKAMRERYGTRSYIFTCDKPITWNQQAIGRAFGYDSLIDRRAWRMDEMIGNPAKLSDGSFLRQSVELLRQGHIWPEGESRMLTFVTYSGHNPFRLPDNMVDPQFDMREKDLPRRLCRLYRNGTLYRLATAYSDRLSAVAPGFRQHTRGYRRRS